MDSGYVWDQQKRHRQVKGQNLPLHICLKNDQQVIQSTIMDKEEHRTKLMKVLLPSPCQVQIKPPETGSFDIKFYAQNTKTLFWWDDSSSSFILGIDNMSVWVADHSTVYFSLFGSGDWGGSHSLEDNFVLPQLSRNHNTTEEEKFKKKEKKKKSSTAVMASSRCGSALIFHPQSETRFTFCPLWSV